MDASSRKPLTDTSAYIVAYAMSRLDKSYLAARGFKHFTQAFREAAERLGEKWQFLKALRDEFDPVHGNARRGWNRPIRPSRQRVIGEFCDVSDAALLDMVDAILRKDPEILTDVVEPLSQPATRVSNAAERLRTGRRAEDYFCEHSECIAGIFTNELLDHRPLLRGYDFAVDSRPLLAIEVKGLKRSRGDILFTDREWTEARYRGQDYWLVVIGNLEVTPTPLLIKDPAKSLDTKCAYREAIVVSWRAVVAVT